MTVIIFSKRAAHDADMALITFSKTMNDPADWRTGGRVLHGIVLKLTQLACANQGRNYNHAVFTATRRPCFDCGAHVGKCGQSRWYHVSKCTNALTCWHFISTVSPAYAMDTMRSHLLSPGCSPMILLLFVSCILLPQLPTFPLAIISRIERF